MTEPVKRVVYEIRYRNGIPLVMTREGWDEEWAKRLLADMSKVYSDLVLWRITKTDDVEERVE